MKQEYKIKACCIICEHCVYVGELSASCSYRSEQDGLIEVEQCDYCKHFAINPDIDVEELK